MGRPQDLRESATGLKRTLVHLAPYLRPERRLIAGSLMALLMEVAFRLLEPWPLKVVFDVSSRLRRDQWTLTCGSNTTQRATRGRHTFGGRSAQNT